MRSHCFAFISPCQVLSYFIRHWAGMGRTSAFKTKEEQRLFTARAGARRKRKRKRTSAHSVQNGGVGGWATPRGQSIHTIEESSSGTLPTTGREEQRRAAATIGT